MCVQELLNHVRSEEIGHPSVIFRPTFDVRIGITPEQVAQESLIGNVRGATQALDLVHLVQFGANATMTTKDLLCDDRHDGHAVKAVTKDPPDLDRIAPFTLVVESVDAINRRTFVIPTQETQVVGVSDLVGQQKTNRLEALHRAVNVVPEEQVVTLGGKATHFKQAQEIRVLAMSVTTNVHGGVELQEHRLREKDLARFSTEKHDFVTAEVRNFGSHGLMLDTQELLNDRITDLAIVIRDDT